MSGTHQLEVLPDADAVAARGAEVIAERAGESISDGAHFNLAARGGRTPWGRYGRLEERDLDWSKISIFQTDERIAIDELRATQNVYSRIIADYFSTEL